MISRALRIAAECSIGLPVRIKVNEHLAHMGVIMSAFTGHKGNSTETVLSLYYVTVDYRSETSDWDTYTAFTVQAHSESEAKSLCMRLIGEFHAEITLNVLEVTPMTLVPRVVASERLTTDTREAITRSLNAQRAMAELSK